MAVLAVKVVTDVGKALADLRQVETQSSRLGSAMQKGRAPALAVGAGLVALGGMAASSASELQQSAGAVESVFKSQSAAVKGYADDAAQATGLAESEYQAMAATIGAQLKNMGTPTEALATQTNDLVQKGADLAATFGGSTSDAVAALSSLMRGEADPIERYGVSIKQADIAAQKAKMGLSGLTGEADKNATAQAMMALLTQQTADAQGAFAREATTSAGAAARAGAEWENAGADLGATLLPAMTAGATYAAQLARAIADNTTTFLVLAGVVAVVAGGVLAYNAVVAALPAIHAAVTAAQWLWNAAMTANPIGLVILGVVLLVAAIVLLVRNHERVRQVALAVWAAIKAAASAAASWIAGQARAIGTAITNGFNAARDAAGRAMATLKDRALARFREVSSFVQSIPTAIATAFNSARDRAAAAVEGMASRIRGIVEGILGSITSIPGRIRDAFSRLSPPAWLSSVASFLGSAPASDFVGAPVVAAAQATFAAGPVLPAQLGYRQAGPGAAAGDQAPVVIHVHGALDPSAVARQIRDILNSDARRRGAVAVNGMVAR